MPRVGSSEVDVRAVRMIHDWIAAMPGPKPDSPGGIAPLPAEDRAALATLRSTHPPLAPPPTGGDGNADRTPAEARTEAIRRLASTTRGALMLLDLIDRGPVADSLGRQVVAIARSSPAVEVRDLFERFIPEEERVKRLGEVVNRPMILALRGDARRGREVFTANPATPCKSCHRAGGVGEAIGPDLTKIGAKYDRAALLEQILEPSKTIDPQYIAYLLETKDGRVSTGLVVEKSAREVVLKDAQGKTVRVPGAEVKQLVPQSRSLMPELLLRDLTAQQVADLLEFLTTLR
jgi:putative heme-binding domain-containing protein